MTKTRTETDTFGPIEVAADRYWGAQAQRSLGNFKIGWEKQPLPVVRALGIVKRAAAETNRDLSQRRALSVRDELIKLGISPNRLSAVGYGEDYPIADNRTPGGRAANRRVEIHRLER